MKLWLDDVRKPPFGYVWAKTFAEAEAEVLGSDLFEAASLDHDLGLATLCAECDARNEKDANPMTLACECRCHKAPTGYDFVCWMERYDLWPLTKPLVHSMNPVGRERMRTVIDLKWHDSTPSGGGGRGRA